MAYTNPHALSTLHAELRSVIIDVNGTSRVADTLITQFLTTPNQESAWNNMNTVIQAFLSNTRYAGLSGLRVLITLSDGVVAYDSSKGANNTYANYRSNTINENHNSRVAIMTALLGNSGNGYETKYSTSTGVLQAYNAIRIGYSTSESLGCSRISVNAI